MPFYGLDQLDAKIADYVTADRGVFVELGAYDGILQNNTLHFEERGWTGVLIEPQPEVFARCVQNRPKSKVYNCACVPRDYPAATVEMASVGLMSIIRGSLGNRTLEEAWIARGETVQSIRHSMISVPARTLDSVLDDARISRFDLLVLDVEGAEIGVLQGLDLEKHRPEFIVCEDAYNQSVAGFLQNHRFIQHAVLSERKFTRDVLYRDSCRR